MNLLRFRSNRYSRANKHDEHVDQTPLGKIQQQYWTTKQQVRYSLFFFALNLTKILTKFIAQCVSKHYTNNLV